ncbi:MAG TPA: peptidoglycan DD-metalloendopeptidase family protein [Rhizomicrobium sp.]|jgi:murein DD-endopeptidase MepM/ murein hydrolase activator NlpD|nr:peptidoglycan DD-metalloendopeptidase family protein [Rhizomicrobium sp.]
MAESLLERAWAWLHTTFPERQIYIRSDGRVQFFTFGPSLQATLAGLSLIFLGWVAFASVNVIFKDRIIASKDHRYQQMQSTYENRVADLQLSYDELNGALVSAEDRFKSKADELETKQKTVARLLNRKQAVDATFASLRGGLHDPANETNPANGNNTDPKAAPNADNIASDSLGADAPSAGDSGDMDDDESAGGSELSVMPETAAPQPRTAKPTKASLLDNAVQSFASLFNDKKTARPHTSKLGHVPALKSLAHQTARIEKLSHGETTLLVSADREIVARIDQIQDVMKNVGINPDEFEERIIARNGSDSGIGGPLIPLDDVRIEGIADHHFTKVYADASAHVKELDTLFIGFRHIPLTTPVHGSAFHRTSGFGARVDPFTHHVAFHPGIDFGGPWGAPIRATAPGVVDYAGRRGGYGNMVEIDHGYGIKTRYGHMSSILVKVGAKVSRGTPVGKLGSTGRSTGPHVHYEVWLANVVRNPKRFIKAGRNVFQQE